MSKPWPKIFEKQWTYYYSSLNDPNKNGWRIDTETNGPLEDPVDKKLLKDLKGELNKCSIEWTRRGCVDCDD